MKLAQNQVWQRGPEYLRIVRLERKEVRYKAVSDLLAGEGEHHHVSKKEFCRLIKEATLLTPGEVRASWLQAAVSPAEPPEAPTTTPSAASAGEGITGQGSIP